MTTPRILSATSINGTKVKNHTGEDIGKIEDLMIDWRTGKVSYAVLSFGGFMGFGNKLFAFPMDSFKFNDDKDGDDIVLDVPKEKLKDAPGFDKDNWPTHANNDFVNSLHSYYGRKPVSSLY